MTKKVIINISTIRVGGGVQVAINLINESFLNNKFDFYYITNKVMFAKISTPPEKTLIVSDFPSSPFNIKVKKSIKEFVQVIDADLIYSVGAPSYVSFDRVEVLRLTNPWLIERDIIAYKLFPFLSKMKLKLSCYIKKRYLRKPKYFITQTEDAKSKIVGNLKKNADDVFVISNTYSYNLRPYVNIEYKRDYTNEINILCLAAPYVHKNLDICVEIAQILEVRGIRNIRFFLTIADEEWEKSSIYNKIQKRNLSSYFVNEGRVELSELPDLYTKAHIFFLPTLLEVFSVSLLEAMVFQLPILTTNFGFNKTVCGDAAVYCKEHFNAQLFLDHIMNIVQNEDLRHRLVVSGREKINKYNSNIYDEHFKVLGEIIERH